MVWDSCCFEDLEERIAHLNNQSVNYGGVCRTAPATPGLLVSINPNVHINRTGHQDGSGQEGHCLGSGIEGPPPPKAGGLPDCPDGEGGNLE